MRSPTVLSLAAAWAIAGVSPAAAIVVRHDIADEKFRADPAAYPELFWLYTGRQGYRICVATLIAPQWAITAAHCTQDSPLARAMAAPAPAFEVRIAGRPHSIDRVVRHPSWDGETGVDMALLRLSEPVDGVRPAPLYLAGDEPGLRVLMVGWGGVGTGLTGAKAPDPHLRVAGQRIDRADGHELVWAFDAPHSGRAEPDEGISGPGDSGGPALLEAGEGVRCVVGVSSRQETDGKPEGVYGVREYYARVSAAADWIREVAGAATAACPGPRAGASTPASTPR